MVLHVVDSCVRGLHVYKDIWTPITEEVFSCEREDGNPMDMQWPSRRGAACSTATCSLFMQRRGAVTCRITDSHHQYSSTDSMPACVSELRYGIDNKN